MEDTRSAFRTGVLVTVGVTAILVSVLAIIFALSIFLRASSKDEPLQQSVGRRAEIKQFLISKKLNIEERAVGNNVLACIDTALASGAVAKQPPGLPLNRAPAAAGDDPAIQYESMCTEKLISDAAIANGNVRAQQIVNTLRNLGFDVPLVYR
jgi:hypothetical protein